MSQETLQRASESKLLDLICSGSEMAFAVLVKRHTHRYYQFAVQILQSKHDAEDVVQVAFLKLWQNPSACNLEKAKFTTWFYKVVLNECRDLLRKEQSSDKRIRDYLEDCLLHAPQWETGEDAGLQARLSEWEQQVALEFGLAQLNPREREALNLVVYAEVPQLDAAAVLGVSLKALESILLRAKKRLTQHVDTFRLQQQESRSGAKVSYLDNQMGLTK